MAQEQQPLGLQFVIDSAGAKLSKPFRLMHQKKVTAVLQSPGSGLKKIIGITLQLMTGFGVGAFLAGGEIGGIGYTDLKTAGRKKRVESSQIGAYTAKTGLGAVDPGVFQSGKMRCFVDLQAGNLTGIVLGAQKQTQCSATGA